MGADLDGFFDCFTGRQEHSGQDRLSAERKASHLNSFSFLNEIGIQPSRFVYILPIST
jgi:hypothetical protein